MWHGKLHLCNRENTYLINYHKIQWNTKQNQTEIGVKTGNKDIQKCFCIFLSFPIYVHLQHQMQM